MSPNPIDDPELYDVVSLGGVFSPGVVTLSGHDDVTGWDIKSASGKKGATTTRKGSDPCRFTASFKLTDAEDFAAWPAFLSVIRSTVEGATPTALDIYHPDLAENGIGAVVKATVKGTVHDGQGGQTKVVEFLEYRPPAPAKGSPNGSKAGAKNVKPDPNAAAQAELARLAEQYKSTPWG